MKVKESYYVLRVKKSAPMKFFNPDTEEFCDDFRDTLKFTSKTCLDLYIKDKLKKYELQGLDITDGWPFCQYEPMRVNVTWEF